MPELRPTQSKGETMSIADCPNCAHGNHLDDDVVFGNIECQECKEIFYWSRTKQNKYLRCQACGKVFNVNEMYSVDACSEDCQAALCQTKPLTK
jgi:hypothetical protein